jgi:hypothetical protein
LRATIQKILQEIELSPDDMVFYSSMFSVGTSMFPRENIQPLSAEGRLYILTHPERIDFLKKHIINHFYDFFEGFFERIYISSFSDFSLSDPGLIRSDIQVAIRSTSHVDSQEYLKLLMQYVLHYSKK